MHDQEIATEPNREQAASTLLPNFADVYQEVAVLGNPVAENTVLDFLRNLCGKLVWGNKVEKLEKTKNYNELFEASYSKRTKGSNSRKKEDSGAR